MIGVASTIAYAILYLLLRGPLGADGANALALALTAVANTQANRRFTFQIRGRAGLLRQHAAGARGLPDRARPDRRGAGRPHRARAHPGRLLEVAVLVAATTVATVTRYMALRSWVFARRRRMPGDGARHSQLRPAGCRSGGVSPKHRPGGQ